MGPRRRAVPPASATHPGEARMGDCGGGRVHRVGRSRHSCGRSVEATRFGLEGRLARLRPPRAPRHPRVQRPPSCVNPGSRTPCRKRTRSFHCRLRRRRRRPPPRLLRSSSRARSSPRLRPPRICSRGGGRIGRVVRSVTCLCCGRRDIRPPVGRPRTMRGSRRGVRAARPRGDCVGRADGLGGRAFRPRRRRAPLGSPTRRRAPLGANRFGFRVRSACPAGRR